MLTVERPPEQDDVLSIHADIDGLRILRDSIDALLRATPPEHVHLMTPSWSGWELSEEPQAEGARIIHQLTIHFWQ